MIKPDGIFVDISIELISAENLGNFNELIVVVVPMKEWFFSEYLEQKISRGDTWGDTILP